MRNRNIIRIVLVTAFILLIPLVAMVFTDEVDWSPVDFVVMGILLFGTGLAIDLTARKVINPVYRRLAVIAILAALFLIWADLSVGIFNIPGISGS